jgi:rod shape-determining protein MreD
MNVLIQNIIRFGLLLGIQIFLLRNVELDNATLFFGVSLFKPFLYLLFILMLPINLGKTPTMLIAFVTGLVMDKFSLSSPMGLHTSACVLIGFIRPFVIQLFFQQQLKESNKFLTPSLSKMGLKNFMLYIIITLSVFMVYFYIIDFWSLRGSDIIKMLLKIISCLFTTILLVVLSQVLFIEKGKQRKRR